MTGPSTLKELMQAGDLTMGEARRITINLFNNEILQDVIPYTVTSPKLEDLPDHVQQFVIKAILESKIVNFLETDPALMGDNGSDGVADPDHSNANTVLGIRAKRTEEAE